MPIHIGSVEVKDRNLVLNGDFKFNFYKLPL